MSRATKTLERVVRGKSDANIRFDDLCALLSRLGFVERVRGDHHIFTRDGISEILNIQPRAGKAKVYQVKQVRGVLVAYGLGGASEEQAPATEDVSEDESSTAETEGEHDE